MGKDPTLRRYPGQGPRSRIRKHGTSDCEGPGKSASLLIYPVAARVRSAAELDAAAAELDEEEHMQPRAARPSRRSTSELFGLIPVACRDSVPSVNRPDQAVWPESWHPTPETSRPSRSLMRFPFVASDSAFGSAASISENGGPAAVRIRGCQPRRQLLGGSRPATRRVPRWVRFPPPPLLRKPAADGGFSSSRGDARASRARRMTTSELPDR